MTRAFQYLCTVKEKDRECARLCGNKREPTADQRKMHPTHQTLGTWHCPAHGRVKVARVRNKAQEEAA